MRRILPVLFCFTILLGACAPNVTLLTRVASPTATATIQAATMPPPAAVTRIPAPTQVPNLGIRPDMLQGVEVLAWDGWDGSASGMFQQMASEFTLSNQWGIKARVVPQGNLTLLAGAVDKALSTAGQPDMVVALPEQILAWQEHIVDLSAYAVQPEFGMSANEMSGAFWEQSHVNGKRLGLPAARSARFLFYNTSFARQLGFNAPPQSPDEFSQQACAANAFWKRDADPTNDGYGGLALDLNTNWQTPYSWLAAGGAQIFVDGEFRFDSPANISALSFVPKLREDGCAWMPDPAGPGNAEHFATRRALFITGSLDELTAQKQAFEAAGSTDDWTVLPFPGKQPVIVAYGPDYALLKSSDARQLAAWLFMRWMLEPSNQVRWTRATGTLPVTAAAAKLLAGDAAADPQWAAALALIPDAAIYPQTPAWRLANKTLADGFMAYFLSSPNATLQGVLNVMDVTVKDLTK
jgi:ABC-type glycerol-3-phosphate transport system substrate-binding protein